MICFSTGKVFLFHQHIHLDLAGQHLRNNPLIQEDSTQTEIVEHPLQLALLFLEVFTLKKHPGRHLLHFHSSQKKVSEKTHTN